MPDVVCIGETMAQLVPLDGDLETGDTFQMRIAGSESNVATALARLDVSVAWASRLGADALGRRIRNQLSAVGVDVGLVEIDPARPTGIFLKQPAGQRRDVVYYRDGSAASQLDRNCWHAAVDANPAVIFCSGIDAALSATSRDSMIEGLDYARSRGVLVALDVNYRPVLWRQPEVAAQCLLDLARTADIVLAGWDEAAALWQVADAAQVRALLPTAELVLREPPVQVSSYHGDTVTTLALPHVDVVEAVGAGDAFAAGYLYGHLHDWPPLQRLKAGHVLAASSLRRHGDESTVTRAELQQSIRREWA
ncbi:MAG: sugar kinase [Beutenbergiaceae bacterium]